MEKYNDLSIVSENWEKPRAYYIPHRSLEGALTGEKEKSSAYRSLNGQWDFCYVECPQDLPDDLFRLAFTDSTVCFRAKGSFEFSALHHTIEALDEHTHAFELPETDSTEVIICYKNRGIGSGSCVVPLLQKYRITDTCIDFAFRVGVIQTVENKFFDRVRGRPSGRPPLFAAASRRRQLRSESLWLSNSS